MLLDDNGLRILRGRAGSGKSYVLGQANSIASNAGINVIGLAPTHRAKIELGGNGFESVDTIKGMLFKLANGRYNLPKGSLLVVDEAGMIGNDDMSELLRVAATRKCNVILSGDERQLASVSRGGMFEIFANKYGSSSILDIKRQDSEWGKNVAMAMSHGNVETAISILDGKQRIKWEKDAVISMSSLLSDWSKSDFDIDHKLILAVKNKDVAAINHGARQYLKLEGKLTGEEVAVDGNYYMQGDKILITKTDKNLGLVNGDLAVLTKLSTNKFTCSINNKEISFNPSEYNGFRHGYATTIFKAQGASIKDVYVYHDGFAGIRNSYVALSRNKINLNLYANRESTAGISKLIKQLSLDSESGSSLEYLTKSEFLEQQESHNPKVNKNVLIRGVNGLVDFAFNVATKFSDKYIPSSEYYNYQEPNKEALPVEKVIEQVAKEQELVGLGEHKIAVGDNNYNNLGIANALHGNINTKTSIRANTNTEANTKSRMTSKERFYTNAQYSRNKANARANLKQQWDRESYELREAAKFKAEAITRNILGDPNSKLSNKTTLRYGEHGKLAVRISGDKAGTWYDFSTENGGDIFSLVQNKRGGEFKDAAEYLRQSTGVGMANRGNIKLVYDHKSRDEFAYAHRAKQASAAEIRRKEKYTQNLYKRSKEINNNHVAHRYLNKVRGISCELSADIKTTGIYDNQLGKSFPALVVFARDGNGNVTGGQRLLLDPKTSGKANVDVPKKSFGKVSGSFVAINREEEPQITIIAEGLETALSVKQGLSEHSQAIRQIKIKIICSLGLSNIKNYPVKQNEKIIIASDNDGKNSFTYQAIENAKIEFEKQGAFVEIVRPEKEGDFNDILRNKENVGSKAISDAFKSSLVKHTALTVSEYFGETVFNMKFNENENSTNILTSNDKASLAYIEKYNLPQDSIIDAYRKSDLSGRAELVKSRKELELASDHFTRNQDTLKEARSFGYDVTISGFTKQLMGKNAEESKNYCTDIRDNALSEHLRKNLSKFDDQKLLIFDVEKMKPVISAEQNFLKETYKKATISEGLTEHTVDNRNLLMSGQAISLNPEKLDELFTKCENIKANDIRTKRELCEDMTYSRNIDSLIKRAGTIIERHNIQTIPADLAKIRERSVSLDVVFDAIEKEQNHLADQHGKIKYLNFETELLDKCKLAYNQREDNELDNLKKMVNRSLVVGAKTEANLIVELKGVTNLEAGHQSLRQNTEEYLIQKEVALLQDKANEVKSVSGLLSILSEQQELAIKINRDNPNRVAELGLKLSDSRTLESLARDCNFLINNKIKSEDKLLNIIKNTDDLKSTTDNLFKESEPFARLIINSDLNQIEYLDKRSQGKEVIEFLAKNKEKHQNLSPYYIEDGRTTRRFERVNDRAEIYRIVDEHMVNNPKLATKFKEEMDVMGKFNVNSVKESLVSYKNQGLEKAVEYANSSNKNYVLRHLENEHMIGNHLSLKGQEYVDVLSKDKDVMRYIDQAISKNLKLNPFAKTNNSLIDYTNQRDINNICEDLSSKAEQDKFTRNAVDLKAFGNSEQLQKGLEIYKSQDIDAFGKYTSNICTSSISKEIKKDLVDLEHGRRVEFFDGKKYHDKPEYLRAISENKQVMSYIEPKSNIEKEITAHQQNKNHDFER